MLKIKDLRPMAQEHVTAGPFVVTFHRGSKGDHFIGRVAEPMNRSEAFYRGMMIKGCMTSVLVPEGASLTPDYIPGMISEERPPFTHAGRYVLEATEDDCLFLCLQRRNSLERYKKKYHYEWLLNANSSFVLPRLSVLALGSGEVEIGGDIRNGPLVVWAVTKAVPVTVRTPLLGIIVST